MIKVTTVELPGIVSRTIEGDTFSECLIEAHYYATMEYYSDCFSKFGVYPYEFELADLV